MHCRSKFVLSNYICADTGTAQLHSGEAVAVKVQRPGVPEQLALDAHLLRFLGSQMQRFAGTRSDLVAVVDEMVTTTSFLLLFLFVQSPHFLRFRKHANFPRQHFISSPSFLGKKGINACAVKTTRTWVGISSGWTHVSGGGLPPRRSKCRAICSALWPPHPLQYFILTLVYLCTWSLNLVHFTLSLDVKYLERNVYNATLCCVM